MLNTRFLAAVVVLLSVIWAGTARAEEAPPSAVGRVSAATGAVSLRPAGGEWGTASVNDPIIAGMAVRTAAAARAALGIGAARIALSGATETEIARLDDTTRQIAVRQGRIGIHLTRLDPGETVEIDLPQGGVWLLAPGDYDITAGNDQIPARIAVFAGQAHVAGSGADRKIAAGSTLVLNAKGVTAATTDSAAADDFVAAWRPAPDALAEPVALRHVSPEMTGWETLDGAGSWEEAAGFGEVWFPKNLPDDWAPYRYGHWRWVMPWGWSWVDDAAWGFVPSHYGRWARIPGASAETGRWAWVPGMPAAHPVYMPAAVNFLGTAGIGLSCPDPVGTAVAWFPLAPGEAYWPSYTTDLELIRRTNAGSVKDTAKLGPGIGSDPPGELITAAYQNRRFASVVPRAVFAGGRAVAPALVPLPADRLANAPLLPGSPQIMPPASKPMVVAVASAVHTLARILSPHPTRVMARTLVLRPNRAALAQARSGSTWGQAKSGSTVAHARSVFAARVGSSASRAKARAVAAYARSNRGRTHLAAATTTRTRLH
jgi:hypothetical protein